MLVNQNHPRQDIHRTREAQPNRSRYRFAAELLPPDGAGLRIVDIGGGAGEFTEICRQVGYQTTLVDGNESSVLRERERGYDALKCDLTQKLEALPTGSFDGAVCLEVVEHIVPAEQLLAEIARVTKPAGFVILSTPNFGFLADRLKYTVGCNVKEEGYHFRFFTKDSLRRMLSLAGLEMDATASIGSAVGVNMILRSLSGGRLRVPPFRCPEALESWLSSTFVYRLRRA